MFFQISRKLPIAMIDKFQNGSIPGSLSSYLIVLMSYNIWNLNPLLFWLAVSKQQLSACQSICLCTVSCRPTSVCLYTGLEFNQKVASLSCQHLKHVKITMMNIIVLVELGGLEPLTLGIQSLVFNKLDHLLRVSRIPKDGFSERRKTWTNGDQGGFVATFRGS